jgi:hypothetical protein
MATSGRISVLVSKELQTLASAIRELPKEVAAQVRKQTIAMARPEWEDAVKANVTSRMQTRVLADTARVSVSDSNVLLRSGGIGKMANGTPKSEIASAVEFGASREVKTEVTNKQGTSFARRTKRQFKLPRARGYVVIPAAREIIPRMVSLWIQTTVRTTHEQLEKGGAN